MFVGGLYCCNFTTPTTCVLLTTPIVKALVAALFITIHKPNSSRRHKVNELRVYFRIFREKKTKKHHPSYPTGLLVKCYHSGGRGLGIGQFGT